jgi:hypothetical protein
MIRSNHHASWTGFLALLLTLNLQHSASWPTGAWHRVSETPVISPLTSPQGDNWESAGTFNPAVVVRAGKVIMLYRAQDKQGTSRLGYAESSDGLHFTRRDQPVLWPTENYEKGGGVEDPRLVHFSDPQFGDVYYLTYTAYNKKDAQLCLATSRDLIHWQRQGVILPAYRGNWNVRWTKSGAIIPEKIGCISSARPPTKKIKPDWPILPTSSIGQKPQVLRCCRCGKVNLIPGSRNRDHLPS